MAVRRRDATPPSSGSEQVYGKDDDATMKLLKDANTGGNKVIPRPASQNNDSGGDNQDDDLSVYDLMPAIIVSTLVSAGSYYSCNSLEMAEDIIIATLRTFVQLSLLASFLSPMFRFVENKSKESSTASVSTRKNGGFQEKIKSTLSNYSAPILVLAYLTCFMLPLAAYEASSRTKLTLRPPNSPYPIILQIVMMSLFTAVTMMGFIAIFLIVKPTPRYCPRHLIPLCGMLFNNCLSSISLALDILFTELTSKQRDTMELMISFGADTWTATRPSFRTVLASALKPQINSMNVIGLVAIPGMMTGQVLGGASPVRASRYQIVIMCLILGAGFVSVGMTTELVIWNVFDDRGVLRDGWIVENDSLRVSQLFSPSSSPAVTENAEGLDENGNTINSPIAVELRAKDQSTIQQNIAGNPLLDVHLHGEYANGKRIMTAKFIIPTSQDIVIVSGPSGIGKSTLLRSIAELSSGFESSSSSIVESISRVSLFGQDRSNFSPSDWRRRVIYLPQHSASTLQGTPESFIQFIAPLTTTQQPTDKHEQLMTETSSLLLQWDISSPGTLLARPWSTLSGGESQRVMLAIAAAARPQLLLLDEPTSALDDTVKMKVEASLRLVAQNGCALLMVTHDDDQARRMGTKWLQFEFL